MDDLEGKVAVITGGASGIGWAMAQRFAGQGMKVVLADIEEPALEARATELTEAGHEVLAVVTDVSKAEPVQALRDRTLERFGAVHLLCNNAGVGGGGPMQTLTDATGSGCSGSTSGASSTGSRRSCRRWSSRSTATS